MLKNSERSDTGWEECVYNRAPMLEDTQPTRRLDLTQPTRTAVKPKKKSRKDQLLLLAILLYFFAPLHTNILLLGADDSAERGSLGRTDTIILTTIVPLKPYVGMLSIPRDLWVNVPGVGEQRINTAYFFSESNKRGSGGKAATNAIRENFGISVRYYAIIHMQGLVSVIDALGGVDVKLDKPTAGYPAGTFHLDGVSALAFTRNRSVGDDFGRMEGGQALIKAVLSKMDSTIVLGFSTAGCLCHVSNH